MKNVMRAGGWIISASLLLPPVLASAAHFVAVRPAVAVQERLSVRMLAEVLGKTGAGDSPDRVRSYRLGIKVPAGAVPDVRVGSSIRVFLPVIHHAEARAKVMSVAGGEITLLLADQIQRLEGLKLKAELPLKPVNLYRIPFTAVYSPRGITTEAFVHAGSRVRLVPVSVLDIRDDGGVVVSSPGLAGAKVVVDGSDNLVSGDEVVLAPAALEVSHD